MTLKILIVEDVFIEADHLSIVLKKAGHTVTGIAKSVEQALNMLKKEPSEMVMLDIFLKGQLTGIHLAAALNRQGIPFVYLSANSNPSTLEAAKATNPFGFLVKPFREKDILIALDIAAYRHRQMVEHLGRQENLLSALLGGVTREVATRDRKLLLLIKGLQQFTPFDLIAIDMKEAGAGSDSFYCFQRIDLEEYRRIDVSAFRRPADNSGEVMPRTGTDFHNACLKDPFLNSMRKAYNIQSSLPILFREQTGEMSRIVLLSTAGEGFSTEHADLLRSLQGLLATVIADIRGHARVAVSPTAVTEGSRRSADPWMKGIVGRSPKLLQVVDLVRQVALAPSTVLISGETGVGKEGIAGAIHHLSERRDKPLVKINCAAIPDTLVESELFGHERGAFTDAIGRRIGKFEQAQGGTVFLDEIGELPLSIQGKLLRVLQEKEIERVGGAHPVKIDVRVIAATNRDLHEEVARGRFRMDLYYRIHVFPIVVPPLRERKEDIRLLAGHFLESFSLATGAPAKALSPSALTRLMDYSWPGNIRQLQHVLERHILVTASDQIDHIDLPPEVIRENLPAAENDGTPQQGSEKDAIIEALNQCNGKVSGKGGAAELLGINPNTFSSRMRKLGIRWNFISK